MEKYGVDTEEEEEKTADTENRNMKCPECGKTVIKEGNVRRCPRCGSKPFEPRLPDENSKTTQT